MLNETKRVTAKNLKHNHDNQIVSLPDLNVGDLVLYDVSNYPLSSSKMKKCKANKSGPFHIKALEDYPAFLTDMNSTILNDMIPIRKLHKISGYTNSIPADVKSVGETMTSNDGDNGSVDSAKDTLIIPMVIGNQVNIRYGLPCHLCCLV